MLQKIVADSKTATSSEGALRITETGAYCGRIIQAEQFDTQGGATMFRFYFVADDGASAWLSTCIVKRDGSPAFGMGMLHALSLNAGLSELDFRPGKVRTPRGDIANSYRCFELESRRVGLILQVEPREYMSEGEIRIAKDMGFAGSFNAETGLTYSETKSGAKEAKAVAAKVSYLLDHPRQLRKLEGNQQTAANNAQAASNQAMTDDCPF